MRIAISLAPISEALRAGCLAMKQARSQTAPNNMKGIEQQRWWHGGGRQITAARRRGRGAKERVGMSEVISARSTMIAVGSVIRMREDLVANLSQPPARRAAWSHGQRSQASVLKHPPDRRATLYLAMGFCWAAESAALDKASPACACCLRAFLHPPPLPSPTGEGPTRQFILPSPSPRRCLLSLSRC